MAENQITIRPYKPGDEEAINNLFNRVFHKSRTHEEWNWKFRDNPASKDPSEWIIVAERNGCIIGHYASLATEVKYGNRVVTAGQPVDTIIDPSVKAGIKLVAKLYGMHIKYNNGTAPFGFGFPNEAAYMVGKKFLGYQDLGELVQFFKRLSIKSALRRRFPLCPGWIINLSHHFSKVFNWLAIAMMEQDKYAVVRIADSFDERTDKFWDAISDRYGIMTVRNLSYLNWRYKSRQYKIFIGEKNDELTGYAVTKVEERGDARVGYIMDFLSRDDTIISLISGVLKSFLELNVDYVLCGLLRHDPLRGYFKKTGFREHKGIQPIRVVVTPLTKEIDTGYLLNQKNWHLMYGDTDGF
ncbi:MAG: GNAT family N-acetyltransferase [Candidatus Brocadia sp.]|jgi:hypothetical protein